MTSTESGGILSNTALAAVNFLEARTDKIVNEWFTLNVLFNPN